MFREIIHAIFHPNEKNDEAVLGESGREAKERLDAEIKELEEETRRRNPPPEEQ